MLISVDHIHTNVILFLADTLLYMGLKGFRLKGFRIVRIRITYQKYQTIYPNAVFWGDKTIKILERAFELCRARIINNIAYPRLSAITNRAAIQQVTRHEEESRPTWYIVNSG